MSKSSKNSPDFVMFKNINQPENYLINIDILFDQNNGYYYYLARKDTIYICHVKNSKEIKIMIGNFKSYFKNDVPNDIQKYIIENNIVDFRNNLFVDEACNFFKSIEKIEKIIITGIPNEPVNIDEIKMEIKNLYINPGTKILPFNKKIHEIYINFSRNTTLDNLNILSKHNFNKINITINGSDEYLNFLPQILIRYGISRDFDIDVLDNYLHAIYDQNNYLEYHGDLFDEEVVEQFEEYFANLN